MSVCPPEFAEQIAEQVAGCPIKGRMWMPTPSLPERTQRMARRLEELRRAVCGWRHHRATRHGRNRTWLYLSGDHAAKVASYFSSGPIEVEVLPGGIGQASALKMCFAAYSKGSIALASAVLSAAENLDVLDDLKRQWARNGPSLPDIEREISRAAPKAWRFAAEMREIAETFESAGLPVEFHQAAAEIFRPRFRPRRAHERIVDATLQK